MPAELQAFITNGYNDGLQASSYLNNARNHLTHAGTFIGVQDWVNAKIQLHSAADDFGYFNRYLLQDDVFYKGLLRDWKDAFEWINNNWPSNGEVTMDAILTAMITSDFDELQKFIGLVDAYRVAIWNAPFNADFYAALARGFSTWPQY